jgi:hypothetical protein
VYVLHDMKRQALFQHDVEILTTYLPFGSSSISDTADPHMLHKRQPHFHRSSGAEP